MEAGTGPPRPRDAAAPPATAASPVEHYDDLAAEEVIALLGSLEREDLATLRDYERRHANRERVLAAIDSVLARARDASLPSSLRAPNPAIALSGVVAARLAPTLTSAAAPSRCA